MTPVSSRPFQRLRALFTPERAPGRPSDSRPNIVFDPSRCNGCGKCEEACRAHTPDGSTRASRIEVLHEGDSHFVIQCQHCLNPLCLEACPQGAISRKEDGIVRIDRRLCVDCGMCQQACPQAAPLRDEKGEIVKCDLCEGDPACVKACDQKALSFTRGKSLRWIRFLRWPVQLLSFLLLVVVLAGSVCSLNLLTLDLACPFGALQNVFSAKSILLTTIGAALFLVVLAFVLGRAFCGWLCPFGFILDLVDLVLPKKVRLPAFLQNRLNKYGVAVGGLAASGLVGTQAFCTICPIGTVCRSYGVNSMVAGAELAIVPAIAALDAGGKRSWCRYLCPVGAVFALAARVGLVRIEIGAAKCKKFSCMRCATVCPMGIIPEEQLVQGISPRIDMSECITCLRCVDICPHKAASIRFVWQKPRTTPGVAPLAACSGGCSGCAGCSGTPAEASQPDGGEKA